MTLSDTEIRQALIMGLKSVADEIENYELPISQTGYEVFGKDGVFGDKSTGEQRFWVASVVVTGDKSDVQKIQNLLRRHDSTK